MAQVSRDEAAQNLADAMQWLLDDLRDAGEDRHPETGEEYDSVTSARLALQMWLEAE